VVVVRWRVPAGSGYAMVTGSGWPVLRCGHRGGGVASCWATLVFYGACLPSLCSPSVALRWLFFAALVFSVFALDECFDAQVMVVRWLLVAALRCGGCFATIPLVGGLFVVVVLLGGSCYWVIG
jgi:hypothetical protein